MFGEVITLGITFKHFYNPIKSHRSKTKQIRNRIVIQSQWHSSMKVISSGNGKSNFTEQKIADNTLIRIIQQNATFS